MLYRSMEIRNLIAIFLKLCFYEWWSSWDVNLWSFCDLKLIQSEKISQIKLTLCPTHEGMVEIASVLDFFKKHNTTSTVDPECKKSANFTTNGPPFRSRFCPFDFVTKRKKNNPPRSTEYFLMREKLLSTDEAISKNPFWAGCGGGPHPSLARI